MQETGSLLLVSFIEKQTEGATFERQHWPLHITLLPWFVIPDTPALDNALVAVARVSSRFFCQVGEKELFGTHRDVPVNVIADQPDVKHLHEELMKLVTGLGGAIHEPRFTGEYYRAHVTRHEHDGRWKDTGNTVLVDDFHLVRLVDDNMCEVVKRFVLRKDNETAA